MNVLVSDTTLQFSNWIVVRTLKKVRDVTGNIDNLVVHKSTESSEDKIKYLKEISQNNVNCKIIYICDKENADNVLRMFVIGGLNGKYIDDEFFLSSENELNALISDLNSIVESTELASSSVLKDFITRYLSDKDMKISKGYLQVVKNAVIEMSEAYHAKSLEILKLSESASEVFSNSIDIISQVKEEQLNLERNLDVLREKKKELEAFSVKQPLNSSVIYFPKVNYLKNKKVICIKDLGRCDYLTSFSLGFREYLEKVKALRAKIVFIEGNGKLLEERYKSYQWVKNENKNGNRNFLGKVVFTNFPTSSIMTKLIDDTDYDVIVVVDRTLNYKEHLVNCKGSTIYAISSESWVDMLKLQKKDCFTSHSDIQDTMFTIKKFNDYPNREMQRVNTYLSECKESYEMLCMRK